MYELVKTIRWFKYSLFVLYTNLYYTNRFVSGGSALIGQFFFSKTSKKKKLDTMSARPSYNVSYLFYIFAIHFFYVLLYLCRAIVTMMKMCNRKDETRGPGKLHVDVVVRRVVKTRLLTGCRMSLLWREQQWIKRR